MVICPIISTLIMIGQHMLVVASSAWCSHLISVNRRIISNIQHQIVSFIIKLCELGQVPFPIYFKTPIKEHHAIPILLVNSSQSIPLSTLYLV